MRLIRFGPAQTEKPGILDSQGIRRDLSGEVQYLDFDRSFFACGGLKALREIDPESLPIVPTEVRWGAPIARPGKIICIGLNYADHAAESGMAVPAEPIIFFKAPDTVVGPYDDVLIPRCPPWLGEGHANKTDWEVELGVVIGDECRHLAGPDEALQRIAGYCISNDVSERHFQLERGGQWVKGKSCDTFNPLGPWLLTADEAGDVGSLPMRLDVNDRPMQRGNTRTMVFDVGYLVYYLSWFMTLEPGDLITTGTPPGVGLGQKPPMYLRHGDVMELSIEKLGVQRQTCRNA
jgi:2-keto-4-pentenoate hydratase/2-oxohepta-3-ene-1,7-dioic acid hydratase in catechol pathway